MITINDCSLKPNPANINSAVSVKVGVTEFPDVLTVKEIDQQAKFPLRILRNLGVYFGLDTNK